MHALSRSMNGVMQENIERPHRSIQSERSETQGTYRHSSRLLAIGQINQWQRGIPTRHLQPLIDAQEDRSIDGKLDIRAFSKKGIVELHGGPKVAEAGGSGCRCLCCTGASQPETLTTFSGS